jgi:hypothetical protein
MPAGEHSHAITVKQGILFLSAESSTGEFVLQVLLNIELMIRDEGVLQPCQACQLVGIDE